MEEVKASPDGVHRVVGQSPTMDDREREREVQRVFFELQFAAKEKMTLVLRLRQLVEVE